MTEQQREAKLIEAMHSSWATTGPDDEDYTYYGPLLRSAPTFTAADIAAQSAADARRAAELAAEQARISTIRGAPLAVEDENACLRARVAELEAQLGVAVVARTSVAPDWSTAPHWANWWAMDGDGTAWWYEDEPIPSRRYARWIVNGDGRNCAASNTDWRSMLVARPQAVQP